MKHANKLWLILAVIALIGFVVISCDNGNGNGACTHTAGAEATCTTAQTCTKCGDVIQVALGHDESGAAATCTTAKICARANCNHELAPADHNIVEGRCTDCGVLRLYDMPIRFDADTDETNFAFRWHYSNIQPLSDFISGTPVMEITGTGEGRRLTIELDAPKPDTLSLLSEEFGLTVSNDARYFYLSEFGQQNSNQDYIVLYYTSEKYSLLLIYVDKDATLNGYLMTFNFDDTEIKKGWNFLIRDRSTLNSSVVQVLPADHFWTVNETD